MTESHIFGAINSVGGHKSPYFQKRPDSTERESKMPTSRSNPGNRNGKVKANMHNGRPTKASAAVLEKRREGRKRAMARLQSKLEEYGVKREDEINDLPFSTIPQIQLINQKNYFTDYLKKDEQFRMIRQVKERVFEFRLAKKRKHNDKAKNQDIITKLKHTPSVASNLSSVNSSGTEDDADDDAEASSEKVLILHPGSENVRIGLSTDISPKIVKNLVARKLKSENINYAEKLDPERETDGNGNVKISDTKYVDQKKKITANFKERMRYYKRRIVPNSHESCINFNKRVEPEIIPIHNDSHSIDYLKTEDVSNDYVVGDDVLKLEDLNKWMIRSPFCSSGFNDRDLSYKSSTDLLGDIEALLFETLKKYFGVSKMKELSSYSCILIIPDLYNKYYLEEMARFLLNIMGFHRVALIQEGMASTFGSGTSTGCIVDVGASATKVCCVEDGTIVPNSQIVLDYGSSDVTRYFIKNLLTEQFPYRSMNLNDLYDWRLANELKENFTTFNDANVAVQVFSFVSRKPNKKIEKYQFKVFDEVMISPMALFYPEAFTESLEYKEAEHPNILLGKRQPNRLVRKAGLFENKAGVFEGLENEDPASLMQSMEKLNVVVTDEDVTSISNFLLSLIKDDDGTFEGLLPPNKKKFTFDMNSKIDIDSEAKNMTPLDKAIIESITVAGYESKTRLESLYSNISLIGGGSKTDGFDSILVDRLNITRSPLLGCNRLEEITKLIKGWYDEWVADQKKEGKGEEDRETNEVFVLKKSQIQKISNIVSESQLLGIEILPNTDVDPSILSWKGGSVFSRLKIINELWVDQQDWDRLGPRSLNYVSLFGY